jgi:hypothetical protein
MCVIVCLEPLTKNKKKKWQNKSGILKATFFLPQICGNFLVAK